MSSSSRRCSPIRDSGALLIFAIERHDLPLIQASILVIAAIYCFANLVADLLYAYFNPKIRYGGTRS